MFQEIRFALRLLRKNPGFAAIATLSLALGIGAVTATFTLADALLLRPLAVPNVDEIVDVRTSSAENPSEGLSYPDFLDIRRASQSFSGLAAHQLLTVSFAETPEALPQMKMGVAVSDGFFQTLGFDLPLGRGFTTEESTVPGRDAVVILSYEMWAQQFNGDSGVLGRTIRLNGAPFNIVGVVPEKFTGLDPIMRPALYIPMRMRSDILPSGGDIFEQRDARVLTVKGRLRPGVSKRQAAAELSTIAASLRQAYPETNLNRGFEVQTQLESRLRETPANGVLVATLMGLAALVLLIACANLANLMLARSRARSREIAIRLALGAGRLALMRQLLVESFVLSLCGAVAGLVFVSFFASYFSSIKIPTDIPLVISVQLDQRMLLCSLAASMLSVMFFGLTPAWQALKVEVVSALKASGLTRVSRNRTWGRDTLVVGQVALALVLTVAAGLLYDAFRKTLVLNPGFRTSNIAMMDFNPEQVQYSPEQTRELHRQIVERAAQLPSARSAALCQTTPFRPIYSNLRILPEGYEPPRGEENVAMLGNIIGGDYFQTLGIDIVRGRAFSVDDRLESRRVIVVNEEFVRRFWPNQEPIGKRVRIDGPRASVAEVVGVARNGKYIQIAETAQPHLYLPVTQNPRGHMVLLVRSDSNSAALIDPMRELIKSIDPNMPVYNVRTIETYYQQGLIAPFRMVLEIVSGMALTGLLLALVGLLGVVSYAVSRRTREMGIRMAIGATRSDVLRLVLRQGLVLAGTGIVIGLVAAEGLRRLFAVGLVGLGTISPWAMAAAPAAVLLVTMTACYLPARRAAKISAVTALRYE